MKRIILMAALLGFAASCTQHPSEDSAERERKARIAAQGINVVQEDGTLKINVDEKRALRDDRKAGKPVAKGFKESEHEMIKLEVVEQ
jgi:hypothetical protein